MVLIMDEVDGMSGGDRGGVQELISKRIKISKIPIICICNDKYNQKLKSLQNYTQDMPFSRPTKQQILNRMLKIAADEGIQMSAAAMEALIETTNNDIRLIINQLQMRRLTKQSFEYDDIKSLAKKDIDMGPFTAVDKLCAHRTPIASPSTTASTSCSKTRTSSRCSSRRTTRTIARTRRGANSSGWNSSRRRRPASARAT